MFPVFMMFFDESTRARVMLEMRVGGIRGISVSQAMLDTVTGMASPDLV